MRRLWIVGLMVLFCGCDEDRRYAGGADGAEPGAEVGVDVGRDGASDPEPDVRETDTDPVPDTDIPDDATPGVFCLEIDPESVEMLAGVEETAAVGVEIHNCSAGLDLEDLQITVEGEPFSFETRGGGSLPAGGSLEGVVRFRSSAPGQFEGALVIQTDEGSARAALSGRAIDDSCPVAVPLAREAGTMEWSERVTVGTFASVQLSGAESYAAGAEIVGYEWSVVERPANSSSPLTPGPSAREPAFFLDLPGVYTVELVVVDELGRRSCEPASVTITSQPSEAILAGVVWDGEGDIDVHFLHPRGRWDASPYDCYWLNPQPNWGDPASAEDDPALFIDSVNGETPEMVRLLEPEALNYRLGAYLFSDHGGGPQNVSASIWIQGVLTLQLDRVLTQSQFWELAEITWGVDPLVSQVDRVSDGFP